MEFAEEWPLCAVHSFEHLMPLSSHFIKPGCFGNCVGVLVMCVLVFTVFCIVWTMFLYFFFYAYLFLFVFSVPV
jgi:hypothetical protein